MALLAFIYYFCPIINKALFHRKNLNVILISLDAARADCFSFNGYPGELSPNMDKLARSGVIFRQAYCYSGNTTASMGAIFTSRFPYWPLEFHEGGPRWNEKNYYGFSRFQESGHLRPGIPVTIETLPTILKKKGYTTVGISTNPYLTRDFNFNNGFDFFEEFDSDLSKPYPAAEKIINKLDIYLSELQDKKFFAWIHIMDMHFPLRDYGPFLEEARRRGAHIRSRYRHASVSEWTQEAVNVLTAFGSQNIPEWKPGEEGLRRAWDEYVLAYEAEIYRVDSQIGILIEKLRRYELWNNTLVIIVNDHGEEFAEHRYWDHRGQLYEAIVRGNWIMHCPSLFSAPLVIEERVGLIDLLPTILELLGIEEMVPHFDGKSRAYLLEKKQSHEDNLIFGLLDRRAYVIQGDYKLIINADYGEKDRGAHPDPPFEPVELYDLKGDSEESHNLVDELPDIADRLLIRLKNAFLEKGIRFWESAYSEEISKTTKERLKSLGYIK
jgi:arylsulfatase A-like enzyme